ncbi:Uncaracterized surface protein containing fasciclin (FAS1) repeats [Paracoccus isoporae]|uniref:Uncaracterized surface protein containing fasciclin (FAS1) repeats n=1 Tax=Paracoccus isoporae TaxID=591205 RepID=A0A1G6ZHA6_9RHOB|nr:fasciclin domain-containing protein [Paracoccus isoporae]SDE01205.1 Uncaracterized surface protein containing fasciclin (FAS1) repeats [Paracoccus isoporae]
MKFTSFAIPAALCVLGTAAFAQDAAEEMPATVADIVMESEDHTTLETAVVEAEMGEALMGEGPFTVFAPTDAAFEALPDGALEEALMPENRDRLVQILGCHVVETRALAADVVQMIEDDGGSHPVTTMGNCELNLTLDGDMVKINDTVTVTTADLEAGNGVVHVIDGVLLPAM